MSLFLIVNRVPEHYTGSADVAASWNAWFDQLGDSLVDRGNPVFERVSLGASGTVLGGYTLVAAETLDRAVELAKSCPALTGGGGVEVGTLTILNHTAPVAAPGIALATTVNADRGRVFEILSTSEGQRGFWTADCDVTESSARFGFRHSISDVTVRVETEPDRLVRMHTLSSPPGSWLENTTWEWELRDPREGAGTEVIFRHYGFAPDYPVDHLGHRAHTWAQVLDRLAAYARSGEAQPLFSD